MSARLFERLAVAAVIDPDAYSAGDVDTDAVDLGRFRRVMFVVAVGDLGTGASVAFKLMESATANGTYADITGLAITPLTQAGTDADKQAIIEIDASKLSAGMRYVKGRLTVATAACDVAVIGLAGDPRFAPVAGDDLASVDEIVR